MTIIAENLPALAVAMFLLGIVYTVMAIRDGAEKKDRKKLH
jgi:hypothetical protein